MAPRTKTLAAPPLHAQFGCARDGRTWIHIGPEEETAVGHTYAGDARQVQAAAQAINAIPLARDAMQAVLDTCRSDENDVALPTSVVEQLRDALAEMGVRA